MSTTSNFSIDKSRTSKRKTATRFNISAIREHSSRLSTLLRISHFHTQQTPTLELSHCLRFQFFYSVQCAEVYTNDSPRQKRLPIAFVGFFLLVFPLSLGPFTVPVSSSMPCSSMNKCAASCGAKKQKKKEENLAFAKPRPSFYQRKLPDTCVAFASSEGKKIFKSALVNNGLRSFYNLIEQHHTQTEPAFCGVSTRTFSLKEKTVFFHKPKNCFRPHSVLLF